MSGEFLITYLFRPLFEELSHEINRWSNLYQATKMKYFSVEVSRPSYSDSQTTLTYCNHVPLLSQSWKVSILEKTAPITSRIQSLPLLLLQKPQRHLRLLCFTSSFSDPALWPLKLLHSGRSFYLLLRVCSLQNNIEVFVRACFLKQDTAKLCQVFTQIASKKWNFILKSIDLQSSLNWIKVLFSDCYNNFLSHAVQWSLISLTLLPKYR